MNDLLALAKQMQAAEDRENLILLLKFVAKQRTARLEVEIAPSTSLQSFVDQVEANLQGLSITDAIIEKISADSPLGKAIISNPEYQKHAPALATTATAETIRDLFASNPEVRQMMETVAMTNPSISQHAAGSPEQQAAATQAMLGALARNPAMIPQMQKMMQTAVDKDPALLQKATALQRQMTADNPQQMQQTMNMAQAVMSSQPPQPAAAEVQPATTESKAAESEPHDKEVPDAEEDEATATVIQDAAATTPAKANPAEPQKKKATRKITSDLVDLAITIVAASIATELLSFVYRGGEKIMRGTSMLAGESKLVHAIALFFLALALIKVSQRVTQPVREILMSDGKSAADSARQFANVASIFSPQPSSPSGDATTLSSLNLAPD